MKFFNSVDIIEEMIEYAKRVLSDIRVESYLGRNDRGPIGEQRPANRILPAFAACTPSCRERGEHLILLGVDIPGWTAPGSATTPAFPADARERLGRTRQRPDLRGASVATV
jgi:hypothetical protein